MADCTHTTRRGILKAGSAAVVASAAGLTASELAASDLTPVEAFYRQWLVAARITKSSAANDMDDATFDAEMARFDEAAWAVIEAEPTSIRDMALKIIVADDGGDMSRNIWQVDLARQAFDLVGDPIDEGPAALVAGMAGALAAPAATPLTRLFSDWVATMLHLGSEACEDEAELDRAISWRCSVEEEMLREAPANAADMARLVLVGNEDTDEIESIGATQRGLIEIAAALVGDEARRFRATLEEQRARRKAQAEAMRQEALPAPVSKPATPRDTMMGVIAAHAAAEFWAAYGRDAEADAALRTVLACQPGDDEARAARADYLDRLLRRGRAVTAAVAPAGRLTDDEMDEAIRLLSDAEGAAPALPAAELEEIG